ncbi:MAG: replication initiation protein [Bacteroidetes bacterium]|nr:replication initiation protein [Bacteroidota bacterium]
MEKAEKIQKFKNAVVVRKANDLATADFLYKESLDEVTSRLSVTEMKLLDLMISKTEAVDDGDARSVTVKEFARSFDINSQNIYTIVRSAAINFSTSVIEIKDGLDGGKDSFHRINIFSEISYLSREGMMIYRFNQSILPLISNLRSKYYSYSLDQIKNLKSQASIRLFNMLSQWKNMSHVKFRVDNMIRIMCTENIPYKEFKRAYLNKAVDEINLKTSMETSFLEEKKGNKVVSLFFSIKEKKPSASTDQPMSPYPDHRVEGKLVSEAIRTQIDQIELVRYFHKCINDEEHFFVKDMIAAKYGPLYEFSANDILGILEKNPMVRGILIPYLRANGVNLEY